MPILFSENRDLGTKTYHTYNPDTDGHQFTTVQDVSGLLDSLKDKRNTTQDFGKVEEFAHYATIPTVVVHELRKKGIDVFNTHQTKEMLREINQNFPYLKATTKTHA